MNRAFLGCAKSLDIFDVSIYCPSSKAIYKVQVCFYIFLLKKEWKTHHTWLWTVKPTPSINLSKQATNCLCVHCVIQLFDVRILQVGRLAITVFVVLAISCSLYWGRIEMMDCCVCCFPQWTNFWFQEAFTNWTHAYFWKIALDMKGIPTASKDAP